MLIFNLSPFQQFDIPLGYFTICSQFLKLYTKRWHDPYEKNVIYRFYVNVPVLRSSASSPNFLYYLVSSLQINRALNSFIHSFIHSSFRSTRSQKKKVSPNYNQRAIESVVLPFCIIVLFSSANQKVPFSL